MQYWALRDAIDEAKRFLAIAGTVESEVIKPQGMLPYSRIRESTKESAACRRASMDLTRALARLRKP